jgi:competence protein ComEA
MFAITKILHRRRRSSGDEPGAEGTPPRWPVHVAVLLGIVVLVGGGVVGWLALRPAAAHAVPSARPQAPDPGQPALALVFVSGAVVHPGLYHLAADARIADAVAAAGGVVAEADPSRLPDMASRVHDGKQVNVPFRRSTSSSASRSSAAKLDVNTATVAQLRAVPGMPLGLPEAIVDYRDNFCPFRSLTDMRRLLGLDGPTVTGLRPYLRVVAVAP